MKVFILGLPKSGRTTIATTLSTNLNFSYVDSLVWFKLAYESYKENSYENKFESLNDYMNNWILKQDPDLVVVNTVQTLRLLSAISYNTNAIMDNISSPRDFCRLFDFNNDIAVFLNRVDDPDCFIEDYERVGISVIRDYCFWLSSSGHLRKDRWIEYNFRIPGERSDYIKSLGAKNSVYIVKSIDNVISHLTQLINNDLSG